MINLKEEHSKFVKLYSFSSGATSPTNIKLVDEIISHLDEELFKNPNSKFLDPCSGTGTFGVVLYDKLLKYHDSKWILENMIFMVDTSRVNCDLLKKLGFVNVYNDDFLKINLPMKEFDVCIMNPPYTQGQQLLYSKFFEKSLSISKITVSLMPYKIDSNHDKLKYHNLRIKKHNFLITENFAHYFNVGYDDIRAVYADRSIENPIKPSQKEDIPILYPERNRITCIKGCTKLAKEEYADNNGIEIIYKIHKNDTLLTRKVNKKIYDSSSKKTKSPYILFVNHTPSKGRFNSVIYKNDNNMAWSMWTFAFECDTKNQATKLKKWIQSDEIVNHINSILTDRNQYTISKEIIDSLPFYE